MDVLPVATEELPPLDVLPADDRTDIPEVIVIDDSDLIPVLNAPARRIREQTPERDLGARSRKKSPKR